MSNPEHTPDPDPLLHAVHPTEWALILRDWQRADAWVTVHLRGVSLGPGKVTRLPGPGLDSAQLHDPQQVTVNGRREVKWTFDLNDVMAVTAEASR
ncbi:hypothetical protein [Nocardioides sp. R-C-SC26]|uniref:hypothetical protein n=1 Tax=Nocardioides sp. R-C-SC26 TaxID=2870414 RepID=UPI001E2A23C5|nr:hypothetical protein [Nocardioides sp. R-C-SC26]